MAKRDCDSGKDDLRMMRGDGKLGGGNGIMQQGCGGGGSNMLCVGGFQLVVSTRQQQGFLKALTHNWQLDSPTHACLLQPTH